MKSYSTSRMGEQSDLNTGTVTSILSHRTTFNVVNDVTNGDHRHPNLHEFVKETYASMRGTLYEDRTVSPMKGRQGILGQFPPIIDGVYDLNMAAYNAALDSAYEKLRGGLDLAVDALQARQTVRLVGDLHRKLDAVTTFVERYDARKLFKSFKQARKYLSLNGSLKGFGGLWLQYVYGIKPLMQSVYGTFDQLMRANDLNAIRIKARSEVVEEGSSRVDITTAWDTYSVPCRWTKSSRAQFIFVYKLPLNDQQQLLNYTSVNPASWLWENIPFSFVVDWVWDLGGYLRNLETALLFRATVASAAATYTTKYSCKGVGLSRDNGLVTGGLTEVVRKRRIPFDGLPLPKPPQLFARFGWQRAVSSASLLAQTLRVR